ncbi:Sel1 repeat-containing protein [Nitrosomonas cryotolerans]|uniref:Sel1 repeat-containing protein n=1 Tax=Nitrosomonas cryotolerans ATCC 49181 TaxID=1131553 RepID=A0A1N6IA64_9PROT|nr:tetratricopeptide repeat protein [Nitrosomonas cryotolerans]SFQ02244.1 Sel1 repeat-containing protein [Nitrosomonas cryotolerans]SIO28875.1 Sel1 repeat-containing protein [Nitrosomonas cryotolerans ATCC 49181]
MRTIKIMGYGIFTFWFFGAAIMMCVYEIERKHECIDREGWVKGLFWCESDVISNSDMASRQLIFFIKGLSWPIELFSNNDNEEGDYEIAFKTLESSANEGNALAQYDLGVMYAMGQGVLQNYKMATKLWQMAADQGHSSAQYNLGVMYGTGQGVPQDYKMAVKLLQMAADQGHVLAQPNLGVLYERGEGGVLQNYKMAHMFYNIAASNGIDKGRKNRDEISAKMTPQEIAEAQEMAREWMEKHKF